MEGIDAHTVRGYVIHDNQLDSAVQLEYPCDEQGKTLTGRSFHHGRFVMGLRREASKEPKSVQLIEDDDLDR